MNSYEKEKSADKTYMFTLLILIRTSSMSRQSCRSPVFIRRPQQKLIGSDSDTTSPSLQPMALLSLDTNESILPGHPTTDNQLNYQCQIRKFISHFFLFIIDNNK